MKGGDGRTSISDIPVSCADSEVGVLLKSKYQVYNGALWANRGKKSNFGSYIVLLLDFMETPVNGQWLSFNFVNRRFYDN